MGGRWDDDAFGWRNDYRWTSVGRDLRRRDPDAGGGLPENKRRFLSLSSGNGGEGVHVHTRVVVI